MPYLIHGFFYNTKTFNRVQKTLAADSRVDVFEAEDKDVDYD